MDLMKEDQLYKAFAEAINRAASKESSILEAELAALRNGAYQSLSLSFEQRKNSAIKTIDDRFNYEYQKQLSLLEHKLNRSLSNYREELADILIQKLKLQYAQYQQTTVYEHQLNDALNQLDDHQFECVEVSPSDLHRIKLNKNIKIVQNELITAGFIAHFHGGKKKIDETIDAKLLTSKNWFYEHATLEIGQKI